MNQEQIEQLENERVRGNKAEGVYTSYVKDFCQVKRESLFMTFSELPLTAEREMFEVKRMLFAIDTLEAEILSEIETGRLATVSLNEATVQNGHEVH